MTRTLAIAALGLALATGAAFATDFTVKITDAATLAGITAARTAYCTSLPPVVTVDKGVTTSTPAVCDLATDTAYFVQRMTEAAASYAKQYDTAGTKKDAFLATLPPAKQALVIDAIK